MKFVYSGISILMGLLAFFWIPFDAIDSYRYYEYAKSINVDLNLFDFVAFNFIQTFDFIYYLLFYLCIKSNIPIQVITGISIGALYFESFKCIQNIIRIYSLKLNIADKLLVVIYVLCSVSFVTVFGITRFITGLVFFAIGINLLLNKKEPLSYVFFIIAIFTHVGLLMYLILFVLAKKIRLSFLEGLVFRRLFIILAVLLGFISFTWIGAFMWLISKLWILNTTYDYSKYFELQSSSFFLNFGLGTWDIIMFFNFSMILTFLFFDVKKFNNFYLLSFPFYLWLLIALGFSQMWVQRTILFLIPFLGPLVVIYLNDRKNTSSALLFRGLIFVSLLFFLVNIYSYREALTFGFP